jgi:hypothetical protein
MKTKIVIVLVFLVMLTINGCEQKNEACPACGVDYPTKDLPWLKSLISEYAKDKTFTLSNVKIYEYNSNEIIVVSWELTGIFDAPSGAIYKCNGDQIVSCGGLQLTDTCGVILGKSQYIKTIWGKE